MKFPCACGCVIHDTSDNLSYKGKIIADQDIDSLWGIIERLEEPHDEKIDVFKEVSDLLMKNIYQCPECGRVYIENQSHNYELIAFKIESDDQQTREGSKTLLKSAHGENWKGYLFGEWCDDKPEWLEHHGMIMPKVNIEVDGELVFDDYEAFEKRFHEVFEYLKGRDVIGSALLRVNGKRTFVWPGRE